MCIQLDLNPNNLPTNIDEIIINGGIDVNLCNIPSNVQKIIYKQIYDTSLHYFFMHIEKIPHGCKIFVSMSGRSFDITEKYYAYKNEIEA
jgi:hypothetical protein